MMKRLVPLLAVALLGLIPVGAQTSSFKYAYPYYAAILTNVDTVEFFTNTAGTAGTLSDHSAYYAASPAGIAACIEANASSLPTSYNIGGSGGTTPTITCNFYPNNVVNSGFSVAGYTSLSPAASSDADATDGELLIITNSSTFSVDATISSGTIPSGMTLYIFPGYQASDTAVYDKSGTAASAQPLSTFSVDETYAFDTDYSFAKIIPLVFYTAVDVLNTSYLDPTTPNIVAITWNASAP